MYVTAGLPTVNSSNLELPPVQVTSELQGIDQLEWLSYGSGHLHGVLLNQMPPVALEYHKLHREVGCTLHLLPKEMASAAQTQTRQLDPLGRSLH